MTGIFRLAAEDPRSAIALVVAGMAMLTLFMLSMVAALQQNWTIIGSFLEVVKAALYLVLGFYFGAAVRAARRTRERLQATSSSG